MSAKGLAGRVFAAIIRRRSSPWPMRGGVFLDLTPWGGGVVKQVDAPAVIKVDGGVVDSVTGEFSPEPEVPGRPGGAS